MPKAMIKNLNIGWTKVRIEANDGTGKIKWFEGLSTNSAEKMEKILKKNGFDLVSWSHILGPVGYK